MTEKDWKELGLEKDAAPVVLTPAIVHTGREQWLMRRRELITASDAAAILGADPFRRPADVYMEKLGLRDVEQTEPMKWGLRLEPAVAAGYRDLTGREVIRESPFVIDVHPSIPWLGATLDRQTFTSLPNAIPAPAEGIGPLELKVSSNPGSWDAEPPLAYQIQLQIQMACTSASWGAIAAFVSLFRPVVWCDAIHDPQLFALIVPKLEAFWLRVKKQEPPSDDPEWFSRAALRALWPTAEKDKSIELPAFALEHVDEWEIQRDAEAEAKRKKEAAEDTLRALLQDAETGFLVDGTSLTLRTTPAVEIAAYTRSAYRQLRRFWPKGRKRER